LLKSWVVLRDVRQINIPEDIEDLIEAVYSTEDTKEFCLKRNCSDMIPQAIGRAGAPGLSGRTSNLLTAPMTV